MKSHKHIIHVFQTVKNINHIFQVTFSTPDIYIVA